ncbi:glycosyltransferase family 2 protein [Halomarina rubra]|uniref:Glycosyltransferase family 2 protein n=1 Tax=Halomarina rubra TaxID=2071873 RepID=A0ABD6AZM7_9EURY|nr:glycosyltransferase family 2 protein [Halomarina rubra]
MLYEKSVGVVVPAYNEEPFIGEVIETMPPYVDRIYVVDDASTDDTWNEIISRSDHAVTSNDPVDFMEPTIGRVVGIRHEQNRGVGGAIKTGYKHALTDEIDVTAVMGGDGQMNPDYLTKLLDPIVGGYAEYTKANRLYGKDSHQGMSRWRLFGNIVLSGLTRITSGYWNLSDPQNGYTAISLPALEAIDIDSMYEYYGYCNDLLVKLNVNGMRVADVPVPAVYGDEESSISYPEYIVRVSGMLFRNFLWRLRMRYVDGWVHPVVVCYVLGGLLLLQIPVALIDFDWLEQSLILSGLGLTLLGLGAYFDKEANRRLWVTFDA